MLCPAEKIKKIKKMKNKKKHDSITVLKKQYPEANLVGVDITGLGYRRTKETMSKIGFVE